MKQFGQSLLMLIVFSLFLGRAMGQGQLNPAESIFAAPPPPSDIGAPGQRSEAGSRTFNSCRQADKPLTAFVPAYRSSPNSEVVWGVTAIEQPSFWFYVPYASASASGEFVLEDAAKRQTTFRVPLAAKPGVLQVQLAKQAALQVGKPYRWYFNVYCRNRDEIDSYVEGSVTRRALSTALQLQIQQANLQRRISLLAANGIWHDALTIASVPQCERAPDQNWTKLLQSVGLYQLAQEPIANCLERNRSTTRSTNLKPTSLQPVAQ
jgi:hypothetical protein